VDARNAVVDQSEAPMDYDIESAFIPRFGEVEKIFVASKWVGMVFRNPEPLAESPHVWVAYHRQGRPADSREDAIRSVLEHAEAHPDFSLS
jgi:hypothetical protein